MTSIVRAFSDWIDIYLWGVRALLRTAAPRTHGRLLDVGCGTKPHLAIFRPYVSEYVGVEHDASFRLTHDFAASAADVYYDGTTLPFGDAEFDTVVSFSVLEHTPDPAGLFAEMARVLRPGGTMIQHVPFSFRLHEEPHDYYRFTRHALRDLSERNGLEVGEIRAQGGLWSVIAHKLSTFLAFRVLRVIAVAQSLGKLGMESTSAKRPRYILVPLVAPLLVVLAVAARALERVAPIPDDTLAFMLVAKKPEAA